MDEEKLKRICKNMEDLNKHFLDRLQKDIDDLNRCRLEIEQNLTKHNNDLTKICFNCACNDLDRSKDRCKRDKVCDMQIRKSSLES